MKYLQDLVPGCNKITGTAEMLDEIINYVQSLQKQVEFLSMRLATVTPEIDFNIDNVFAKEEEVEMEDIFDESVIDIDVCVTEISLLWLSMLKICMLIVEEWSLVSHWDAATAANFLRKYGLIVNRAPPPATVQSSGGSMLGGIGSTIAQGLAFGTGSAVAHRAVDSVMGPHTIQHETVGAAAPEAAAANNSFSDACGMHSKAFQDCITSSGSDISKCQFYMDMLAECKRNSSSGGVRSWSIF